MMTTDGAGGAARIAAGLVLMAVIVGGCRLGEGRIVPSPLSYSEQERELLAIVPTGTEREAAVDRLSSAGIEGTFGRAGQSIYYCDLWNRGDGQRWHLNVALLFDETGRLYGARPAEAQTGPLIPQ